MGSEGSQIRLNIIHPGEDDINVTLHVNEIKAEDDLPVKSIVKKGTVCNCRQIKYTQNNLQHLAFSIHAQRILPFSKISYFVLKLFF